MFKRSTFLGFQAYIRAYVEFFLPLGRAAGALWEPSRALRATDAEPFINALVHVEYLIAESCPAPAKKYKNKIRSQRRTWQAHSGTHGSPGSQLKTWYLVRRMPLRKPYLCTNPRRKISEPIPGNKEDKKNETNIKRRKENNWHGKSTTPGK